MRKSQLQLRELLLKKSGEIVTSDSHYGGESIPHRHVHRITNTTREISREEASRLPGSSDCCYIKKKYWRRIDVIIIFIFVLLLHFSSDNHLLILLLLIPSNNIQFIVFLLIRPTAPLPLRAGKRHHPDLNQRQRVLAARLRQRDPPPHRQRDHQPRHSRPPKTGQARRRA